MRNKTTQKLLGAETSIPVNSIAEGTALYLSRKNKGKQLAKNATFINRTTNEEMVGDLVGHDEIDGKGFFIVQVGARAMKLSKEGFELKRRNR